MIDLSMTRELYIEWDEALSTGVPLLDEQHRSIVAILNTMQFFIERKRTHEMLIGTLDGLVQHAAIHFKTEETLLAESGYPELERHAAKHRQLFQDLQLVAREATKGNDPRPVLAFLASWWLNHIREDDLRYVPTLTGRKKRR